jgi:hypothetical protein
MSDITIDPGKATYIRLRVNTGSSGVGKVTLRFDAGDAADPSYEQFTVYSIPLSVDSYDQKNSQLAAWPNPATSSITIPLPEWMRRDESARLELFTVEGKRVVDFSAEVSAALHRGDQHVQIPLQNVKVGTYYYIVSTAQHSMSGDFILVR